MSNGECLSWTMFGMLEDLGWLIGASGSSWYRQRDDQSSRNRAQENVAYGRL